MQFSPSSARPSRPLGAVQVAWVQWVDPDDSGGNKDDLTLYPAQDLVNRDRSLLCKYPIKSSEPPGTSEMVSLAS